MFKDCGSAGARSNQVSTKVKKYKLPSSNRWQIFHTDYLSYCMGEIYCLDMLRFLLAARAYSLRLLPGIALRAQTCDRLRC